MLRWLFLFGGLLVWAAHFVGVYAAASIADVIGDADSPGARLAIGALTAVCLAADAVLLLAALRRWPMATPPGDGELVGFWRSIGMAAVAISAAGVVWQGLPALLA